MRDKWNFLHHPRLTSGRERWNLEVGILLHSSLIIIQSFNICTAEVRVLSSPMFVSAEMIEWLQVSWFQK